MRHARTKANKNDTADIADIDVSVARGNALIDSEDGLFLYKDSEEFSLEEESESESLKEDTEISSHETNETEEGLSSYQNGLSWGEIARIHPLLTAEEEITFSRASRTDKAAFNRMVLANIRLVIQIAGRARYRGVPHEDLVSEGVIGLIRAVKKFNPEMGFRFSTYATHWIYQAVDRAIMNQCRTVRIPVHVQKLARCHYLHAQPNKEVDAATVKALDAMRQFPTDQQSYSLSNTVTEEKNVTHEDLLVDMKDPPEQVFHKSEVAQRLHALLSNLTDRERTVIQERVYGDRNKTLEAIAHEWGVTRERVRQIEQEALKKMRKHPDSLALRHLLEGGFEAL